MKVFNLNHLLLASFLMSIVSAERLNLVIEKILSSKSFKSLGVCGKVQDQDFEDIIQISYRYGQSVASWNCSEMLDVHDSILVFFEPEFMEIEAILNQPGAQISLSSNVWLIIPDSAMTNVSKYFEETKLRIGLTANIFITNFLKTEVTQVLGTASKKPILKVWACNNLILILKVVSKFECSRLLDH